jgi:uncharacterized protein
MKKIRILSVDGGGIRGIIPGTILTSLEQILREKSGNSSLKIGDYFDLIAGTSTGGILTCLYLMPDESGRAKYSAQDAVDLYVKNGHTIFSRTLLQKITAGDGILHEKYSYHMLYDLLTSYFGDTPLSKLVKPCLITSYALTERKAVFFTSVDAAAYDISNFLVRDVARATSAAPTYFEPAHISSFDGKSWALVDGGVFANNPALCAYVEAGKIDFSKVLNDPGKPVGPSAKDIIIVSLGTGSVMKQYHYKDFKNAGEIKWLEPILDILMSGNSETVSYQLKQMYQELDGENQSNYYRLEPGLLEACSEMDDTTPDNIQNLRQAGLAFAANNNDLLHEIAGKIIDNN